MIINKLELFLAHLILWKKEFQNYLEKILKEWN